MTTINLCDNQGRNWTVEGDWRAHAVGADFDGTGRILMWISPLSEDALLEPVIPIQTQKELDALIDSGLPTLLPGD
jgi:hypothetical protein